MTVIVTPNGFRAPTPFEMKFIDVDQLLQGVEAPINLDLAVDQDPRVIQPCFCWVKSIRIPFSDFSDGRGFSLAKSLRQLGFERILRAQGHIIADQFYLALQSGFTEIEIDSELARRQPESQWLEQIQRKTINYQQRLLKVA